MKNKMIEAMVSKVLKGSDPRKVWESSLSINIGSEARVKNDTTAYEYITNQEVPVAAGDIVTVIGAGAGPTGVDHLVTLADGRKVSIPFYSLVMNGAFESRKDRNGNPLNEQLTGSVVKVTLTKPIPQGAIDWIEGGYNVFDVQLPNVPSDDTDTELSFLVKAANEDAITIAIGELKKLAGASFESSSPATMVDWSGISAG